MGTPTHRHWLWVGALLLLVGGRVQAAGFFDKARRAVDDARHRFDDGRQQREEAARRAADQAREAARRAADQAREAAERARQAAQNAANQASGAVSKGWQQSEPQRKAIAEQFTSGVQNAAKAWQQSEPQRKAIVEQVSSGIHNAANAVATRWEQTRPQREQMAQQFTAKLSQTFEAGRAKTGELAHKVHAAWEAGRPAREAYLRNLSERTQRVMDQCGETARRVLDKAARDYGPRVTDLLTRTYEKYGGVVGDRLALALERHAPEIAAAVRDPHDAEKVLCATLAVVRLREEFDQKKKEVTYNALRSVGHLQVETPSGRMSLEGLARGWVREKVPALANSSIVADPAEFVTYGLIYHDAGYLFRDLRILDSRDGTGKVSMRAALAQASPVNPDSALDVLAIMADCETLSQSASTGERLAESADAFSHSVALYQREARK